MEHSCLSKKVPMRQEGKRTACFLKQALKHLTDLLISKTILKYLKQNYGVWVRKTVPQRN